MSAALRREVGPVSALLITVGAILGSGVFATPHEVALMVTSPWTTLALWLAGGALSFMGVLSFVELGAALPETGGMYVYLRRAFGPWAAFAFGWAMTVVMVPSSIGFFAQVTARHAVALFGLGASYTHPCAVLVVAVLVASNLAGVRTGAAVQSALTVLKFTGVAAMALLGLVALRGHDLVLTTATARAPGSASWLTTIAALVPVLWAYDGWIDVTSIAGEVRDPARNVPRSLLLGTALITALYLLVNLAYVRVLGTAFLAQTETPAADAAAHAFGGTGRAAVSALVAISTFGGCAVAILTGSRVVYAVAKEGLFFRAFAHTSSRGVPDVAVTACGLIAMGYLTARGGALAEVFVVGTWPFYALAALATIRLRRTEPTLPRPWRTPGYPWTIVVFAATSVAVVVSFGVARPRQTLISLGLILAGLPVRAVIVRWRRAPK